ncbi:MAG: 1,4-dihydroxy-2-naphthoate octaprenyltransferase [Chloroherpetonaceae bacterium]|nr:1,4-dihydroxy-2-naphthoate octaprenyltransferase [Chloroherpetonaceae bacterium]MDW8019320.1 1,4-dihydroxy-2-naphthoate octaprenyltransferase [Chloroherpetonaceae bacterium]
MESMQVQAKPVSLQTWWIALRPFSFTASVTPAVMGGVIALWMRAHGMVEFDFSILNFLLCILGCVAIHSVSNLVNDYFDHKTGLDDKDNFGAMKILVQGALTPAQVRNAAWVAFIIAAAIGAYFIWEAGSKADVLIYLILFGALSAYFYTAPPLSLKYRGLGDVQVILSFAVLMVFGAYYVQTKSFSWLPILYSIPIGLLVDDILHINNLRDIPTDKKANISTLAIWLGEEGAKKFHYVLCFGAFAAVPLMIIFAKLTWFSLLTLLALPTAVKLSKEVSAMTQPNVDPMIVARIAQLHAQFGALMILGFVLGTFFPY